jgi:hypothetical protein
MTILESKGLEFDDVFIWNFLSDSRCQKEWRLVLSYLVERDASERDRLDAAAASADNKDVAGVLRTLDFNEHTHAALCLELKHLYTAITRARVRVVIYDEDAASRAPLFYYLTRRGLCDTVSVLGQTSAQGFAVETSAGSGSPVNPDICHCTCISGLPARGVSSLSDACVLCACNLQRIGERRARICCNTGKVVFLCCMSEKCLAVWGCWGLVGVCDDDPS